MKVTPALVFALLSATALAAPPVLAPVEPPCVGFSVAHAESASAPVRAMALMERIRETDT